MNIGKDITRMPIRYIIEQPEPCILAARRRLFYVDNTGDIVVIDGNDFETLPKTIAYAYIHPPSGLVYTIINGRGFVIGHDDWYRTNNIPDDLCHLYYDTIRDTIFYYPPLVDEIARIYITAPLIKDAITQSI